MKKAGLFLGTIILLIVLPFSLISQSKTNYVNRTWNIFEIGSNIGGSNFLCKDFDGDGTEELLFGAGTYYQNDYFTIFSYVNNTYVPKWTSALYISDYKDENNIVVILTANFDDDDDYEIYVITSDGRIEVYNGEDMVLIETHQISSEMARDAVFADIDDDGGFELIVTGEGYTGEFLHIYDASSFELEYQTEELSAYDVEVGDVDGDLETEIVLSSGYILDGATLETEWHYVTGFGWHMELGDTNEDGIPEIISSTGNHLVKAFDGLLHTPLWQIETEYHGIDAIKVTDVEDDGVFEILIGADDFYVAIGCYNASTQQLLWENTDENSGVSNIGIGDPDNDGVTEFIWGSGVSSTAPDYLHIADYVYHQTEWVSESFDGHFSGSVYDLNIDDTLDLLVAPYENNNYQENNMLLVYNGFNQERVYAMDLDNWYGTRCMKAGNINDTEQGEILIGIGSELTVFDGLTYQELWKSEAIGSIYDFEIADVDNDNDIEIIVASGQNIRIFNGETFEEEWQSINTGTQIGGLEIENIDEDDALEIVFFNAGGIIQVYDGITYYLEWQSSNIDNVSAIEVSDYNQDGIMDIISGNEDGDVVFTRCDDFSIVETVDVFSEEIIGLKVGNLDSTSHYEIFVGEDRMKILNAVNFELIWESPDLGIHVGQFDNIVLADTDMDQYMEVLFGTEWGLFQYEATTPYPDITSPKVVYEIPPAGMQKVGTNMPVKAFFSEMMENSTFTDVTVLITDEGGSTIEKNISYDTATNFLTLIPYASLPLENEITVTLTASISDTAGNGLDGNRNGISEGSPEDDFVWTFTTGLGPDNTGPVFSVLEADSYDKWAGINIIIDGILTDYSDYASSPLEDAEYFINTVGNDGEGIKMKASNGHFDELTEEVESIISTDGWNSGEHIIYFHGKDFIGNWGEFYEITINIQAEEPGSWTMFGGNPQHTGYNYLDNTGVTQTLKWSKHLSNSIMNQACIMNDKVIVSADSYNAEEGLYILDIETGNIIWDVVFTEDVWLNPPSFAYGRVYMQIIDGPNGDELQAYDINTGNLLWASTYGAQWERYLAPTIADGKVFINGGTYGGAYAFDAFHGYEYWFHNLAQVDKWTPAYHNDTVYTFVADYGTGGHLAALNAHSGVLLWEVTDIPYSGYGSGVGSAPIIDTVNRICIVSSSSHQHAICLDTHEILWEKTGEFVSPAILNNIVYSVADNTLSALNINTGDELWTYNAPALISYQPVISGNHIFFSTETDVYAVNINDHEQKWHFEVGGHITVGRGYLLVSSSEDGELYAFGDITTEVGENKLLNNERIKLYQNYPNPVPNSGLTSISYYLPKMANVQLTVYDLQGIEIAVLENGNKTHGKHTLSFSFENISPGMYFYKLIVNDDQFLIKKMIVF